MIYQKLRNTQIQSKVLSSSADPKFFLRLFLLRKRRKLTQKAKRERLVLLFSRINWSLNYLELEEYVNLFLSWAGSMFLQYTTK